MKKLLVIITLVTALFLSAATALAASPSLVDKAHLLTASERVQVQSELQAVEQKYGIRCAVVTMGSIGNTKPGIYANQLIDKVFNDGANGNIVFLQVTDQRQWYISTDKKLKDVVVGIPGTEYISKAAVPCLKKATRPVLTKPTPSEWMSSWLITKSTARAGSRKRNSLGWQWWAPLSQVWP